MPGIAARNAPGAWAATGTSGVNMSGSAASKRSTLVAPNATNGPKATSAQPVRSGLAMPTTAATASRAPTSDPRCS